MNTPIDAAMAPSAPEAPPAARAPGATTRPLYWCVRRELWENRSIYMAPLIAAGIMLLGTLISTFNLAHRMRVISASDTAQRHVEIAQPYTVAAIAILVTAVLVAVFYCLDALHGERRDRSILFWKSLPVSDATTVLAKVSIPLVVLPVVTFVVIVVTQLLMLLSSALILAASGLGDTTQWAHWTHWPMLHDSGELLYEVVVIALWYAPIYGWLLLVSAWAHRMTFLWAVLTPLALCIAEKVSLGTSYLWSMLKLRLIGSVSEAFTLNHDGMSFDATPDPLKLLTAPGLWIGLAVAAALVVAAIRLRRQRGPI